MRVVLTSVKEFCDELQYNAADIYLGVVRMRVDEEPIQEGNPIIQYGMWLTTLVDHNGEKELLEFGQVAEQCRGDSQVIRTWQKAVQATCDDCNLRLRPGKIELW